MDVRNKRNPAIFIFCWEFLNEKVVGSRRWKIFSNELYNKGYKIHIICKEYKSQNSINYKFHKIKIPFYLKFNEPINNLFDKILWKIQKTYYNLIIDGANYHTSDVIKKKIQKMLIKLPIQKNDILIISTGPHKWSYYIINFFKGQYKHSTNIIVDIRDRWSDNKFFFNGFSEEQICQEKKYQDYVLLNASKIICVHKSDKILYSKQYNTKNIHYLLNPALPKFIASKKNEFETTPDSNVSLFFGGTLYNDGISLELLTTFLDSIKLKGIQFTFKICGNWDKKIISLLEKKFDVDYLGIINETELQHNLKMCDFVISYISFIVPDYINTKIIDCVSIGKPILVISSVKSYVFDFIKKNKLGKYYLVKKNFKFNGFPNKIDSNQKLFSPKLLTNKLIDIISS